MKPRNFGNPVPPSQLSQQEELPRGVVGADRWGIGSINVKIPIFEYMMACTIRLGITLSIAKLCTLFTVELRIQEWGRVLILIGANWAEDVMASLPGIYTAHLRLLFVSYPRSSYSDILLRRHVLHDFVELAGFRNRNGEPGTPLTWSLVQEPSDTARSVCRSWLPNRRSQLLLRGSRWSPTSFLSISWGHLLHKFDTGISYLAWL